MTKHDREEIIDIIKAQQNDVLQKISSIDVKIDVLQENIVVLNERLLQDSKRIESIELDKEKIKHNITYNRLDYDNYIKTRLNTCPQNDRIGVLETDRLSRKALIKWIITAVALSTSFATAITQFIKIL